MSKNEKLKQFFEQLRGKSNPTALDIRSAAAATGDVSEITPVILSYAFGMGINAEAELTDLTKAQETARQKEAQTQAAAALAAKAGELTSENAPEKRRELLDGIRRIAASLDTPGKKGPVRHMG